MIAEKRFSQIMQVIEGKSFVTIDDLVESLGVSESTIRRDLKSMDSEGLLKRVHGGAMALSTTYMSLDEEVTCRRQTSVEDKREIARYAATLIEDDDFIYVDSGTTTELIIDYIKSNNVVIVTNNLSIARNASGKCRRVFLVGGEYKAITDANIGPSAVEELKNYNFIKAFFGANGVDFDLGYTTPDMNEAMVKRQAFQRSIQRYVLVDNSKIGKITSFTFGEIEGATLITKMLECNSKPNNVKIIDVANNDIKEG